MTNKPASPQNLLDLITKCLELLDAEFDGRNKMSPSSAEPLSSLYQQCIDMVAFTTEQQAAPLRMLHHFACTGGTLIAKHLSLMPNVKLLSELDPLSELVKPHFSPTDLVLQLRSSLRKVSEPVVLEVFLSGLTALHAQCLRNGERLVLRDHSHSHFCVGPVIKSRKTLRQIVTDRLLVRSVVTIRHPLDSFLSLSHNKWLHFSPSTLAEYAYRYHVFLDAYVGVPTFTYEAFVENPEAELKAICTALDLPFIEDTTPLASIVKLTGDSGRAGTAIGKRVRRDIPPEIAQEAENNAAYHSLCTRLNYDP